MSALKTPLKQLFSASLLFAVVLIMSSMRTCGVPGLTISVQDSTNIVLGWPSTPGTTYLIQNTYTLSTNIEWQDLTNFYPANLNSNWTSFTITNAVITACEGDYTNNVQSGGPPGPNDEIAGGAAMSASSDPSVTHGIAVPPSPWIPETLPSGAVLEMDGTYVPIRPPQSTRTMLMSSDGISLDGGVEPDGITNGDSCEASGPGFFRVVANGVTCIGITNNEALSGMVTIPLEIVAPNGDPISGATLQVDGSPAPGGLALQASNNLWTFMWDTTTIPNGVHQITVAATFGEDAMDLEMTNSLTVAVTNVLWFPYYYSQGFGVGTEMWVYAQAIQSNIDWEIDLYDSQTNYLGSFGDYSPDGSIDFVWGLQTNQDSPPLTDPGFRLDYYLWDADTGEPLTGAPMGGANPQGSGPAASKWMVGEKPWNINAMLVACGPIDGNVNHTYNVQDMMRDGVLTACQGQFPGGLQPQPNDPHGEPWTWGANGDKHTLLQNLPGCQFLYYFGHGTSTSFGPNTATDIKNWDLMTNLANFPGFPYPAATNRHPYKLVFLDGCLTGGGTLCECFGIPTGQYDTNFFLNAGLRTRAYIGYNKEVSFNPDRWATRAAMLQNFYVNFFSGHSINYCVTNAEHDPNYPMDSSVFINGATSMDISMY